MEFLRRKRTKPPIKAYGPPALHTVTVELRESWVRTNHAGEVPEERLGPSYRWTPELTHANRLWLVQSLSHINRHQIRVSGGSISSIELRAWGKINDRALDSIRQCVEVAQAASVAEAQQARATS